MLRVEVELGKRSYPILIGSGLLEALGAMLRNNLLTETSALVVTDSNVAPLYFEKTETALRRGGFARVAEHVIPCGEDGKSWEEYSRCCDALLRDFPDVGEVPVVVALGGGVVGDLAGFAAGTFRRGVPYVQVPTTLLSAVDSSVGGKTGVNHGNVKNIMGIIYQPRLVVSDLATLDSLSEREFRSGMAEVIKYGAVCDAELFEYLEANLDILLARDAEALREVVAECVKIKANVVQQDETDTAGVRIVLNFGHTIGHALEMAAEGALTHGEAISVGMIAATNLGIALDKCDEDDLLRLDRLLQQTGLPRTARVAEASAAKIMASMRRDKKFQAGRNRFVVPTGIGKWETVEDVPGDLVERVVRACLT
jgi:3-dehydroquinate synthase